MSKSFLKKALIFLLSIFALSVLIFTLSRLAPGDPLRSYYGDRVERMGEEERMRSEERLGLNEPLPAQYLRWAARALSGDFGVSFKYKMPAGEVVAGALSNTLLLGLSAFVLTFLIACLIGAFCARREKSLFSSMMEKIGVLTSSLPDFWFALILILVFSVTLRLFPSSGAFTPGTSGRNAADRIEHLVLPLLTVVLSHAFYYGQLVRDLMAEEMKKDYVLFLRGSGIREGRILGRHVLVNILPALFSLMISAVPHLIGGEFVVEMVFSYPGLGTLAYESARYHDYNLLMLITLITGAAVLLLSMLTESLAGKIDPALSGRKVLEDADG